MHHLISNVNLMNLKDLSKSVVDEQTKFYDTVVEARKGNATSDDVADAAMKYARAEARLVKTHYGNQYGNDKVRCQTVIDNSDVYTTERQVVKSVGDNRPQGGLYHTPSGKIKMLYEQEIDLRNVKGIEGG